MQLDDASGSLFCETEGIDVKIFIMIDVMRLKRRNHDSKNVNSLHPIDCFVQFLAWTLSYW